MAQNTELTFETQVEVDPQARVKMPLTALGALLGGLIAMVATGIVFESLVVIIGGVAGWLAGLVAAVLLDRYRKRGGPVENMTRDELYAEARRQGVDGRSDMTKDELAAAVRDDEVRAA